jgi:adenine nucleotide transporter 17
LISLSTRAQVDNADKKSIIRRIKQTLERDGLLSFFDGLDSSLLAIGATNAIYYYFYEESRALLFRVKAQRGHKTSAALSTPESMLISSLAGAITSTCVNPIWVSPRSLPLGEC